MADSVFINLHHIAGATWRRRYLVVMPCLLLPICGFLIGKFSPLKWQAHTTILVQESAKLNPFLEDLSVATDLEGRIATLKTLSHSRHVLLGVAEDLGKLNKQSTDSERDLWVAKLAASLTMQLVGKDLVKLTYTTDTVEDIDITLQAISNRFLENLLAPELTSMVASEAFLLQQINERREVLRSAEQRLAVFKRENAAKLPNLHSANATRLAGLRSLLEEKRIALKSADVAKAHLQAQLAKVDPLIGRLEDKIMTLKGKLTVLRSRYTDKHSKVASVLKALVLLEKEKEKLALRSLSVKENEMQHIWAFASSVKGGSDDSVHGALLVSQLKLLQQADLDIQQLQIELNSVQAQVETMQVEVADHGEMERTLAELSRDLNVKRALYDDLLARFEKAKVTGALGLFEQPERIKIIDKPYKPSRPINPAVLIFVLGGFFGGIALGAAMALIAELLDSSVRRRDKLEELLGTPVLTRIPAIHFIAQPIDIQPVN
ncbi:MAG: capsule biosynthesis protein [Pseudomonadales bacterium]|nr:capsule biosynthesis protein [Pseudomonadales bacterium]